MGCEILYTQSEQTITTDATPVTAFTINPPIGEFVRLEFKVLAVSHDGISKTWSFAARIKSPSAGVSILGQLLGLISNGDLAAILWDCYYRSEIERQRCYISCS